MSVAEKRTEGADELFKPRLDERKRLGSRWSIVFLLATVLSVFFLATLVASIVDKSFGYVLISAELSPKSLEREGRGLAKLSGGELRDILSEHLSRRLYRKLDGENPLAERSEEELLALVHAEVVKPRIAHTWTLTESLLERARIREEALAEDPEGELQFRSWVNPALVSSSQSSDVLKAGIRGAILGSFLTIMFTILIALPLGVAAAIWLEEYARDNRLNRIIETNIYNLAGVPSIIYGMLGLALFVRGLAPLTSGSIFGVENGNGRTILSASLTLSILILPMIIINAQEALKAVPATLRQSSLAVGATKWQTIWHHVLPSSIDRILTGAVLAVSRALGETAPLVVVGASTFLSMDPSGPFSKFTTLPIQIYQWTARPQPEFRNLAAGAILVLLILLLSLNGAAIITRNKYRREKRLGR